MSLDYEIGVRLNVLGHASSRWRGAKTTNEASRLNEALSIRRANAVRSFVEPIIRSLLPMVRIDSAQSSIMQTPSGFEMGSRGVGSSQPLKTGNAQENDALNRSVELLLDIASSKVVGAPQSRPGLQLKESDVWNLKIVELETLGVGVVGGRISLVLRNFYTGREMVATADLAGGGVSLEAVKKLLSPKLDPSLMKVGQPIGKEITIITDRPIGFSAFAGKMVYLIGAAGSFGIGIPKTKLGVGIGFSANTISLGELGPNAQNRLFDEGVSFKTSTWGTIYRVAGTLKLVGENPGEWVPATEYFDAAHKSEKWYSGHTRVSFPTGADTIDKLTTQDRLELQNFARSWARKISDLLTLYKFS